MSRCNKSWAGLISAVLMALLVLISCTGPAPSPSPSPTPTPTTVKLVSPSVSLSANVSVVSQTESNLSIQVILTNPNSVAIDISDMQVTASGGAGQTLVEGKVSGGSIPSHSEQTFINNISAPLGILREPKIIVTVASEAEAAGTSLPFNATSTISVADLTTLVNAPQVTLRASIKGLTANSELDTEVEVKFSNSNPLRLDVGGINVSVSGAQGNNIKTSLMSGGSIEPKSDGAFTADITLPITAVDEKNLIFTVTAESGFAFINFDASATTNVPVPALNTIINVPQPTVDFKYDWATAAQIPILQIGYEASIENNNVFVLKLSGRRLSAYRPDGTLLIDSLLGDTTVQPLRTLDWSDSLSLGDASRGVLGSEITIKFDMGVGPEGINTAVPISVSKVILVKTSFN